MVAELKRKILVLVDKVEASVVSESLAGSSELESLNAEVRSLWKDTKDVSEEIINIDYATLEEVDTTQAATDAEISAVLYPLELKIARIVTSCKEQKEIADTAAAWAALSTPNTTAGSASARFIASVPECDMRA